MLEAPANSKIDYESRDRKWVFEFQKKPQGIRGFHIGVVRLALELRSNPKGIRGCLVINAEDLTENRLRNEWDTLLSILHPDVASRLAIVAIQKQKAWIQPPGKFLDKVASAVSTIPKLGFETGRTRKAANQPKSIQIKKLLISRWLQRQGPIGIGELADHIGCSYPTARTTIDKLSRSEILIEENRTAIQLSRFPEDEWQAIVAMSSSIRPPIRFVDRSGQSTNMNSLLKRLSKKAPAGVALGGVVAARHWHRKFNLNGIPRIDLLVHAKHRNINIDFLHQIDPALKESTDNKKSPAIVVHAIQRENPDFTPTEQYQLPVADPIETALDLNEMGLTQQANDLFASLRSEIKPV